MQPSVKGTLFQNVCTEILECLDAGKLSRASFEAALKPEEIEIVEGDLMISAWYPLGTYCGMLKLLSSTAPDPVAWLVASGRRSAQRVIDMGVYSQLDTRTQDGWGDRIGRILVTLSGAMFNCGQWRMTRIDDGVFEVEVVDAHAYSQELVWRTQGFIEVLATRAKGRHIGIRHQRDPDGGRVLFMTAD